MFCERMELYLLQKWSIPARKTLKNPRTVCNKLLHCLCLVLMEWLEITQAPETDIVLPKIRQKRKARVVPREEAVSDEELEESGVTDDAELKILQVRPCPS